MPEFRYKASRSDGQIVDGALVAASREAAYIELRRSGFKPLKLDTGSARVSATKATAKVSLKAQSNWALRMLTMLDAGLSLDQALTLMASASAKEDEMAPTSSRILRDVRAGQTFSGAARATGIFSPAACGILSASEHTSDVTGALTAIQTLMEKSLERQRIIKQALIYPAFLLLVAVASVLLMLGFVVPQFEPLLSDAPNLPYTAQIVMAASSGMLANSDLLIAGAGGLALLVIFGSKYLGGADLLGRILPSVPGVGAIYQDLTISNLFRNLGTFLKSDVPVLDAVELAASTVPDGVHASTIRDARAHLSEGQQLSAMLAQSGHFPGEVTNMLRAGEHSASVEHMMLSIADMLEIRASGAIKRYLALLEPVMILLIGLLIGGIVFSIFQAILSVNDIVL